jgi:hypothetical protein
VVFSLGMLRIVDCSEWKNCLSVAVAKVSRSRMEDQRRGKGGLLWLAVELVSVVDFGGKKTRCCRDC